MEAVPRKGFEVRRIDARTRELRVRAPSASTVEVMGDFTEWRPVSLHSEQNGWWTVQLTVNPGIHELNVRIDGGPWTVPQGLPRKSDEFGSSVGVLVIQM
jgi:1,4-alpha-glucan branching enzyme